jgi:hypothetical protein
MREILGTCAKGRAAERGRKYLGKLEGSLGFSKILPSLKVLWYFLYYFEGDLILLM